MPSVRSPLATSPRALLALAGLAGLVVCLALPSGVESPLDGLPWSRRVETWLALALLPWLAILGWRELARPWALAGVATLLLIKLGLAAWAPVAGWEARVFASARDWANHHPQPTWEAFWRPGQGARLDKPWLKGREFPVEWFNGRPFPPDNQFRLWLELGGQATLPPGAGLVLLAGGLDQPPRVETVSRAGVRLPLPVVGDPAQVAALDPESIPRGHLRVAGCLVYGPGNWTLVPLLVQPDGRVEPAFRRGVLWRDPGCLDQADCFRWIWRGLARAGELGLGLLLAAWGVAALRAQWRRGRCDPRLAGVALAVGLTPWLLGRLGWGPDPVWRAGAGAVLGLGLLWLDAWRRPEVWHGRRNGLGLVVLMALGPGTLAAFLGLWDSHLGVMRFFHPGDDWTSYQNVAREIFLGGDWLDRAHPVWHLQPLYRYLVGTMHALGGQATLAQDLLDVWSALGGIALTAALGARLGLTPLWSLGAALLVALPEFAGPFRHHLGRGLQEHAAMLAMLLAAWAAARLAQGWRWALAAGMLAALAYWLRQDHLGVLAGLGFLGLEPVTGAWRPAWREWLSRAWSLRWRLSAHLALLAAAVLAVGGRNWWFGGRFVLTAPGNMSFLTGMGPAEMAANLGRLLLASEGAPDWPALVLLPGTLLGLLALVWRPVWLRGYPLALGLCLAGLLAPYFLVRVSAYTPRFSLHLLPLAALSLALGLSGAGQALRRLGPGSDAPRAGGRESRSPRDPGRS